MELKNEKVWTDDVEGTFRRWGDERYEVTVQQFEGFAYIVRLDVDEAHRGKGLGTMIVQTLMCMYGTVIAAPEGERSRGFFAKLGEEDERGELKRQAIWPLDQGCGVYIME